MLMIVPGSPRYGSMVVGLLTIFQFIFLMWAISTNYDLPESQAGFKVMVVVFSLVCIIASILLIVGAIRVRASFNVWTQLLLNELISITALTEVTIALHVCDECLCFDLRCGFYRHASPRTRPKRLGPFDPDGIKYLFLDRSCSTLSVIYLSFLISLIFYFN